MTSRPVALISENMARELWGTAAAALGKRIHGRGRTPPWREIIGVAERDVRNEGEQVKPPSIVYFPAIMEISTGILYTSSVRWHTRSALIGPALRASRRGAHGRLVG